MKQEQPLMADICLEIALNNWAEMCSTDQGKYNQIKSQIVSIGCRTQFIYGYYQLYIYYLLDKRKMSNIL